MLTTATGVLAAILPTAAVAQLLPRLSDNPDIQAVDRSFLSPSVSPVIVREPPRAIRRFV